MSRIAAAAFLVLVTTLAVGDEETARYFLGRAQAALKKGDLQNAEKWSKRAIKEQPNFAPSLLVAAKVEERLGRRAEAIRRLEVCVALGSDKSLSRDEKDAVVAARNLLKELDEARFALEKLVDDYVRKTLALAAKKAKSDPELARECWRSVLLVRPDNAVARRGLAGESSPSDTVRGTRLFNGKDMTGWSGSAPAWTVRRGFLVGSIADSANINRYKTEVTGDFTLTCVMRIKEDLGKDPLFGIVIGIRGSYDHFGMWIWPESWRLEHQTAEHERAELARREFKSHKGFDASQWNTYRLEVEGKKITGFVNGRKVWSTSGAVRGLDGYVGCWVQERTVEIRTIAIEAK